MAASDSGSLARDFQTSSPVRLGSGLVFPACSPWSSDAGTIDWTAVEEKVLRDVSQWLSPADLRRARLVCKPWLKALSTLGTKATTPPESSSVTKWKLQLEAMVAALPCLQEVTIGSKLSAVGAQQLSVLAAAEQLRVLNIPQGHALQDRSLMALHPLASTLRELRVRNAVSLNQRSLLQLSVFRDLEVLELKQCGKISWAELQEAWRTACATYEAQAAEAASAPAGSAVGKSSMFGGWLPGVGKLSRTSSPSSNTVMSALLKQKSGGGAGSSGFLASLRGRGRAATTAAELGKGAVGNGRSSSGGGSNELNAVRKLLHRKQKQQMTTAATAPGELSLSLISVSGAANQAISQQAGPAVADASSLEGSQQQASAVAASSSDQQQPGTQARPWGISSDSGSAGITRQPSLTSATSALYRVGNLVWQGTTAAAAALGSGSVNRQSTAVQAALLGYLAEHDSSSGGVLGLSRSKSLGSGGSSPTASGGGSGSRFAPARKRLSNDKPLPAMPFTKLVSLSFSCSDVTYKRPAAELEAIAALTTLTSLEMGKCKLPDAVFRRLGSLTRLQRLKMSDLWSMGDEGLSELAKLTTLKCLSLSEAMRVTAPGLQVLDKLTGLTALALGLSQDLGPGTIAKAASSLPGLRCLEVTASCWGDVDCEQLAEAASEPNLAAAAAAAVAAAQPPMMLWNISRSPSPGAGLASRSSSSKLLSAAVQPLSTSSSRSNSSLNLSARPASLSSLPSFGSFSRYDHLATSTSAQHLHQPQHLVVLKLHGCCSMGYRGVAALRQLKHLQTLVLDNCKEVQAAEAISQDLLPPQLVSLTLRGLPFGNAFSGCVNIPACAGALTRLELASLDAAHSGQLRRVLSFFPNLQELSLAGSPDVSDAALKKLAFPKLQLLNLSSTRVTDQAIEQLMRLPVLRMLNLRGCNLVTDAGLLIFELCHSLQELDLSECACVSDRGVHAVMQGVRSLVSLNVVGCKAVSREVLHSCPHHLHLKHSL